MDGRVRVELRGEDEKETIRPLASVAAWEHRGAEYTQAPGGDTCEEVVHTSRVS
jgi:hypothetical protein